MGVCVDVATWEEAAQRGDMEVWGIERVAELWGVVEVVGKGGDINADVGVILAVAMSIVVAVSTELDVARVTVVTIVPIDMLNELLQQPGLFSP